MKCKVLFDFSPRDVYQCAMISQVFSRPLIVVLLFCFSSAFAADTFRVAAYNVENYLDTDAGGRPIKTAKAKEKVRESIRALNAEVLAFAEMGGQSALQELRESLKKEGVDYPYWEHVTGYDTNIHVAVLSKFPFSAKRPHEKDNFLLSGRRFRVSRGFVEVDVKVNAQYSFTLLAAHLKSKRPIPDADEAEMRLEEAKILREKVDAVFARNPNANLVVLGDLNDTKDSRPVKAVLGGRGKGGLVDTRPAERNGDTDPNPVPRFEPRNVTWTHYYGKEDSYSRIDYILISQGMEREWMPKETYILTLPNWGTASDHRPIVATFSAREK